MRLLSYVFAAKDLPEIETFSKHLLFQGMGQKPIWLHQSRNNDRNLQDLQSKVKKNQ